MVEEKIHFGQFSSTFFLHLKFIIYLFIFPLTKSAFFYEKWYDRKIACFNGEENESLTKRNE